MRGLRTLLTAVVIGVGAAAPGAAGGGSTACAGGRWCAGEWLPAPVTVATGGLAYRIERDGRARRVRPPWRGLPRGAVVPLRAKWFVLRRGHLVVGMGRGARWRSRGVVGSAARLGVVVASARMVAFQHDHRLWLARVDAAERAVATRELPLGWTRGGLYTYRYRDRRLLLRSDSGRLVKVIARRPLGSDYQVANGSLYFIVRGTVYSARGGRVRRLAALAALGLSANVWLAPLGRRLLELQDDNRIVVQRADGSVYASMSPPRGQDDNISSDLVVAPNTASVAFTEADRRTGIEGLYLLRAGARAPVPIHRERVALAPCEGGATLQWHGRWLLYDDSVGKVALVDTAGGHRAIDLTGRVARLPGLRRGFGAFWTGRAPPL